MFEVSIGWSCNSGASDSHRTACRYRFSFSRKPPCAATGRFSNLSRWMSRTSYLDLRPRSMGTDLLRITTPTITSSIPSWRSCPSAPSEPPSSRCAFPACWRDSFWCWESTGVLETAVSSRAIRWVALVTLSLNPLLLDLSVAARGYGLGSGASGMGDLFLDARVVISAAGVLLGSASPRISPWHFPP